MRGVLTEPLSERVRLLVFDIGISERLWLLDTTIVALWGADSNGVVREHAPQY